MRDTLGTIVRRGLAKLAALAEEREQIDERIAVANAASMAVPDCGDPACFICKRGRRSLPR